MSASMESSARRRRPISAAAKSQLESNDSYFDSKTKKQLPFLPPIFTWVLLIGLHLGIYLFVHWRVHSFPYQVDSTEASLETHRFYERNARIHLDTLFSFGPRVTGSKANEIYAKEYIIDAIDKINSDVHPTKTMAIDVQNVSGVFHMENILGTEYYSVYRNLKNIVVKLDPKEGALDHLLINCHYDTATTSPGAGDNAVSCSVMLEILRALSHSDHKLRHGIIFLFNGAEENVLQASHGFITQHPWASTIKAFVNLDSAGAGGWEIVFQTGPDHPWLVRAYAEAAHYPFASVLGQELFQAGIIPSDTDFRIFRDFGKIPGLDIAYVANGYIYHTLNDKTDYIPKGCIQRAGENIMNLLKELASNPRLADPGIDKHGAMVFFDFVGYFMIHYPQRIGNILNCIVVGFAFLSIYMKISKRQTQVSSYQHIKYIFRAIMVIIGSWVVTLVTIIIFGLVLSFGGYSLFWYTNTYNILTVYIIPGLIIVLSIHGNIKEKYLKHFEPWYIESVFFDASLLIWSVFVIILTYLGVGSVALVMFWVLGPIILREGAFQLFERSIYVNTRLFLIIHISSLLVPLIITMYSLYTVCMVFIPILGRSGTVINSEIVMAVIGSAYVIIFTHYLVGLVYMCKSIKPVTKLLGLVSIVGLLLVLVTPLGFPYSGNKSSPSSMRVVAMHINRNFYALDGSLSKSDSGIWFLPFDHNGAYHLQRNSVLMKAEHPTCKGPYCGYPYKLPLLHLFDVRKTLYEAREKAPKVSPKVQVKLVSRTNIQPDVIRLTFHVTGPDHMTSYIDPVDGVSLIKWSLSEDIPRKTKGLPELNNSVYFIYYSHAEEPATPWEFYLDLQVNFDHGNKAILEIAFSGQYLHLENSRTEEVIEFIDNLPEWSVPTVWAGTYDSYQF